MANDSFKLRRTEAEQEFNRHEDSKAGGQITAALDAGLSMIRDLVYNRIYFDVEQTMGSDSMLIPLSGLKSQMATRIEIDLFQVAAAAQLVREQSYTKTRDSWFRDWLGRLRLGEALAPEKLAQRLGEYQEMDGDQRRLAFVDHLMKVMPESRRAPLVLFQLLPLSTQIMTAQAFLDSRTASALRRRQMTLLPAIDACTLCHGAVLDNEDLCAECGNPVWELKWLSRDD